MEMTCLNTTQGCFFYDNANESIYVDKVCVGVHVFVIQNVPHAWRLSQVTEKPATTFTKSAQISPCIDHIFLLMQ